MIAGYNRDAMLATRSIEVYAAGGSLTAERINARRQERAAGENMTANGASKTASAVSPATARAISLSHIAERSLAARITAQSLGAAEAASTNSVQSTSDASAENVAAREAASDPAAQGELSKEEKAVVEELKARDREVRNHERAHKAAGGQYAGAISYVYQTGPDGKQYAVGGSVPIDASPEASPEATIEKMNIVISAALAPAEPSGQDQAVARAAQAERNKALAELSAQRAAEQQALRDSASEGSPGPGNIYDALAGMIEGARETRVSAVA